MVALDLTKAERGRSVADGGSAGRGHLVDSAQSGGEVDGLSFLSGALEDGVGRPAVLPVVSLGGGTDTDECGER